MKMLNENRTLTDDNQVCVTKTYTKPRYTPQCFYDEWSCDDAVDYISQNCLIWTPCRDFKHLTNFSLDEDELNGDLSSDLALFQSKIGEEYECYVLGAYIHSGTSFSVSKGGDRRCRFDSSQLGFIAIPKSNEYLTPDRVAEELTAAWNGEFIRYEVYDELNEEVVEELTSYDYDEIKEFCSKMEEKYGVDFSGVDPR